MLCCFLLNSYKMLCINITARVYGISAIDSNSVSVVFCEFLFCFYKFGILLVLVFLFI